MHRFSRRRDVGPGAVAKGGGEAPRGLKSGLAPAGGGCSGVAAWVGEERDDFGRILRAIFPRNRKRGSVAAFAKTMPDEAGPGNSSARGAVFLKRPKSMILADF